MAKSQITNTQLPKDSRLDRVKVRSMIGCRYLGESDKKGNPDKTATARAVAVLHLPTRHHHGLFIAND
jgi:hypothetical protein